MFPEINILCLRRLNVRYLDAKLTVQLAQYREELLNLQNRWANSLSSKVTYNSHITEAQRVAESLQGTSNRLPYPKWITHSISSDHELNSESQTESTAPPIGKYEEANSPSEILDDDDDDVFQEHLVESVEDVLLTDALLQYIDEDEEEARDTSALEYIPGHLLMDREPPVGHLSLCAQC